SLPPVARVMAKAIVANAYGGPEVLALVDIGQLSAGPGQVLVEVKAAGVNPTDYKQYRGVYGRDPSRLPMRIGWEAAGVVAAVGEGARAGLDSLVAVGDEVIAYRVPGAYATELVVPAGDVVHKPANLTFAEASGLMLAGTTASHCLAATAVGRGDTVLVHGAAGGVGLMVVQLAVARGAVVIGTAAERSHERLRQLGATPITYGEGLEQRAEAAAPQGYDAAIDTVGTDEAVDVSLALVKDQARIATIAAFGRAPAAGIKALGGGPGADPGSEIRSAARLDLVRLAGEGKLQVFMGGTYPLAEAAKAHERLAAGQANGKLALLP
ncbi:MAG TPA: NADP-dependent oxidoreductase, partial [Acidimicrobiales bacterium]|nr:NADP-dependent oxidoreductase [Acidimicrobiales bacterium]